MRKMYSEKQLKEIVAQAIQSGEIPVSGGTKLYKHTFKQSGPGVSVSFISSNNVPIIVGTDGSMSEEEFNKTSYFISQMASSTNQSSKLVFIRTVSGPQTTYIISKLDELPSTYSPYFDDYQLSIEDNVTEF